MSTSRDKIIETAKNLDLTVLSGTGSPLDTWRDLRIEIDSEHVLVIRFDRVERVREAAYEIEDGTRRAIRPANVEILRDEMRAAFARKTEAVRIETDRLVAKAKLAAEPVPVSASNPIKASGEQIFDALEASYVTEDGFGTRDEYVSPRAPRIARTDADAHEMVDRAAARGLRTMTLIPSRTAVTGTCGDACCGWCVLDGRPCILPARDEITISTGSGKGKTHAAELPRKRDELTVSTTPVRPDHAPHFVDAAGTIPILSGPGLLLFGRAVSAAPGTQMQKVDGLTSTLLGIFRSRPEQDEMMTFSYDRGHRAIGSTPTSAARFLALEALMSAAIADATPVEAIPSRAALATGDRFGFEPVIGICPACGRPATAADPLVPIPAGDGYDATCVHRSHTTDEGSGFFGKALSQRAPRVVGPIRVTVNADRYRVVDVERWSLTAGEFVRVGSFTREEADALHTALGHELYG